MFDSFGLCSPTCSTSMQQHAWNKVPGKSCNNRKIFWCRNHDLFVFHVSRLWQVVGHTYFCRRSKQTILNVFFRASQTHVVARMVLPLVWFEGWQNMSRFSS